MGAGRSRQRGQTSRLEVFRLQGAMHNLVFFWCKVKGNDDQ